jgi:hypothetical protein
MRDRLNKVVVAPTLHFLVGCSARSIDLTREPVGCELKADAVCASAIENYLTAEVMRAVKSAPSQRPHVVPLVVPVNLPGAGNWPRRSTVTSTLNPKVLGCFTHTSQFRIIHRKLSSFAITICAWMGRQSAESRSRQRLTNF